MQAHLLSFNNFSRPLVLDKADAAYTNIIYLILLSKGKFQSHPDMGVGLRERYHLKTADEKVLEDLRDDITNQMRQYLPELSFIDISVFLKNKNNLGILINCKEGSYIIGYDVTSEKAEAAATYLLSDL